MNRRDLLKGLAGLWAVVAAPAVQLVKKVRTYRASKVRVTINGVEVGQFSNVTYGKLPDFEDAYILGRYDPSALDFSEPITMTCTGFRVVENKLDEPT